MAEAFGRPFSLVARLIGSFILMAKKMLENCGLFFACHRAACYLAAVSVFIMINYGTHTHTKLHFSAKFCNCVKLLLLLLVVVVVGQDSNDKFLCNLF